MHFSCKSLFLPMLLAASASIAAAPMAGASLSCTDVGAATQCGSAGNSQITVNPPPVQQQQPQIIIIHRNGR